MIKNISLTIMLNKRLYNVELEGHENGTKSSINSMFSTAIIMFCLALESNLVLLSDQLKFGSFTSNFLVSRVT